MHKYSDRWLELMSSAQQESPPLGLRAGSASPVVEIPDFFKTPPALDIFINSYRPKIAAAAQIEAQKTEFFEEC